MKTLLALLSFCVALTATGQPMTLNSPSAPYVQKSALPTNDTYGLIPWWTLDNTSGTDSSGNGYTLTFVGSPSATPAVITNGVAFNGSTQSAGTSANVTIGGSGNITIMFWEKCTQTTGTAVVLELSASYGANGNAWGIFLNDLVSGAIECADEGSTGVGNGFNVSELEGSTWSNGSFHHVCFVAQRGSSTEWTGYLDGEPVSLVPQSGYENVILAAAWSVQPVYVAARDNASLQATITLDDVRVYNRALSAAEVRNQYEWPTGGRP
jgi:Concanavalin A-like lectin/glucanases superfamily